MPKLATSKLNIWRAVALTLIAGVAMGAGSGGKPQSPEAYGFRHYFKCPSDADVFHIGDTVTPQACLAACQSMQHVAGCWWLDGTGGFPRECRACKTLAPRKEVWPNDWATPKRTDDLVSLRQSRSGYDKN